MSFGLFSKLSKLPFKWGGFLENFCDAADRLGVGIIIASIVAPAIQPDVSWNILFVTLSIGLIFMAAGLMKGVIDYDKLKKNDEVSK